MNVVDLTQELIATPSINPGSVPEGQSAPGEAAMAIHIEEILRLIGAKTETWEVYPGRPNVTGYLDLGASRTLIIDAHLDTVPIEGMTIDPFHEGIRDGRIYGRGACDVKGPSAAVLCALHQCATDVAAGRTARFNVLYAGVCDEESGFGGVRSFIERLPQMPEREFAGVIVVEPTELHPIIAHKGVIRWTITTRGIAAHSSTPHLGTNAIYQMAPVLSALENYADELKQRPPHPQLGVATLSVGIIQGGSAVNVVPDSCLIQVDRRLLPGETPAAARHGLEAAIHRLNPAIQFEISQSIVEAPAMATPADSPIIQQALAAATSPQHQPAVQVANYCTDASFYPPDLAPALVIGPGSIAQAHTKDEWISIDQLHAGVKMYHQLIMAD